MVLFMDGICVFCGWLCYRDIVIRNVLVLMVFFIVNFWLLFDFVCFVCCFIRVRCLMCCRVDSLESVMVILLCLNDLVFRNIVDFLD